MSVEAARAFLEEWVDANINVPLYEENKAHLQPEADACKLAAKSKGLSETDLVEAADGDLLDYLLSKQNELTDNEVKRLVAKDD